jgi:hypothetical protein
MIQRLMPEYKLDRYLALTISDPSAVAGITPPEDAGVWESKRFALPRPMNLAWARVTFDYDGGHTAQVWTTTSLAITVYAYLPNGETQEFEKVLVNNAKPDGNQLLFRLPEGFLAQDVAFRLEFSPLIFVKRVQLGETVEDVL